jgi:hypothetical protein
VCVVECATRLVSQRARRSKTASGEGRRGSRGARTRSRIRTTRGRDAHEAAPTESETHLLGEDRRGRIDPLEVLQQYPDQDEQIHSIAPPRLGLERQVVGGGRGEGAASDE